MMHGKGWQTAALLAGLLMAVPAGAQQAAKTTTPDEAGATGDARSAVVRFLERDEVERAGRYIRIDTRELAGRVDEMSDSEHRRVASRVAEYEEKAAAADVVTISTTTIILGLLILILLILIL